jgi:hypothetical protein
MVESDPARAGERQIMPMAGQATLIGAESGAGNEMRKIAGALR